jgi:hypothetical protein
MVANKTQEERVRRLSEMVNDTLGVSGNCAQTSFAVLQDEFDLDGGPILKALTPFPGIGLRGETCGALFGSLMALGLVYGRDELDDWKGFISSLPSARRFCKRFAPPNNRFQPTRSAVLRVRLKRTVRRPKSANWLYHFYFCSTMIL